MNNIQFKFTERQLELLVMTSKGMTAKQIGLTLNISRRTVEAHLASLKARLNCHKKTTLIMLAWQIPEVRERLFLYNEEVMARGTYEANYKTTGSSKTGDHQSSGGAI